ncbi:MAG: hypothetical protein HPY85_01195 [Anaerolineae bacterium]|nr:hypothetical protein [Anaerolineae bacterium]
MSEKPEIHVERRRKGSKPARQAAAPVRRGSSPGSRPSSPGSGGLPIPGGTTGKLGCGGIFVIVLLLLLFVVLRQCGGIDLTAVVDDLGGYVEEAEPTQVYATRTPRPPVEDSGVESDERWLVMVYQDADDRVLEQDIVLDLNEMELMGSTEQVMIVSQIDRFRGGYEGVDDWHGTRRYLVTYDGDLNAIGSDLVMDLGEANMADGDTLVDFVTWAVSSYPADHFVLILSDHGMGWPGGWSDPAPGMRDSGSAPLIDQLPDDSIYLSELDDALAQIQANTGIEKFDLIGMDACLMSQMEVYMMLEPYARTAVASEETEPGLGWAYAAFLSLLVYDPSIDAADLAANIVDTYIDQDERIINDQARAEFLQQNSSTGSFFGAYRVTASQLADQMEKNITLTAVDLEQIGALNTALNDFVYQLQTDDPQMVANARNYAQSFTSIFGKQVPASYIDLGHFVSLVAKNSRTRSVRDSAQLVLDALDEAVIAERHGSNKPGATGIAIYFPNSTLYKSPYTGMQSYSLLADRFARVSLWDDFLVSHYNNRPFEADAAEAVVPSSGMTSRSPGSGGISISTITTTADTVGLDSSIGMSAEVSGENIGYLYLFTGYYDADSNSILVADMDYLESDAVEEVNGVYYPVWPAADSFIVSHAWEPVLFAISDGSTSEIAMFQPTAYGASAEEAVYTVQGVYTFAESGEQRKAELQFMDGKLFQVFGYLGSDIAGAPSEITPAVGDTFTLSYQWLELDASGNISQVVYEDGNTLTFGEAAFTWETVYAPYGDYVVGFLVGDLDGNLYPSYARVRVE